MAGNKVSTLTISVIDEATKPAREIGEALQQAEQKVKTIAAEMGEGSGASDRFVQSLSRLKLGADDIKIVANEWKNYTTAAGIAGAETSALTREQISGIRNWETATLGSIRAVVKERAAENAGLRRAAAEQNEILKQQAERTKIMQKEIISGAGMIGMGLGFAGLTGVKDVIKASAVLADQQARLKSFAAHDPSEVPFAEGLAADIAKQYPNLTQADALEMYNETRAQSAGEGGMVDREKAKRNLGLAARTKTGLANLHQDFTAADAQSLQKALESSGRAMNPTAFDKLTDAYVRAKQVYGTAVSAEAFNTAIQNAKASNYSLGDNEFYRKTWARIAEGNAARYGNEQNQTLATLVGGHATKQAAQWLVDHGLADSFTAMGGGAARINNLHGSNVLQTDQGDWATGFLLPALKDALSPEKIKAREQELRADALKANPNAQIDDKALNEKAVSALVAAEVQKMGVRGTVADNLTKWIVGQSLVDRDSKLMDNAAGRDENAANAGKNPTVALSELTGAMSNFASVVGGPLMAPAAKALDTMAHSIENFTQMLADWEKAYPDLAKVASGTAIGAATVGGAAAILGAGLKGIGAIGRVFGIGGGGSAAAGAAAAGGRWPTSRGGGPCARRVAELGGGRRQSGHRGHSKKGPSRMVERRYSGMGEIAARCSHSAQLRDQARRASGPRRA
jgi:hypothetical protein